MELILCNAAERNWTLSEAEREVSDGELDPGFNDLETEFVNDGLDAPVGREEGGNIEARGAFATDDGLGGTNGIELRVAPLVEEIELGLEVEALVGDFVGD